VRWKVGRLIGNAQPLARHEVNLSALDFSKRVQASWSVCAARMIVLDLRTIPRAFLLHFIEIYKKLECLWKNIGIGIKKRDIRITDKQTRLVGLCERENFVLITNLTSTST
jgi:hypothetical protein